MTKLEGKSICRCCGKPLSPGEMIMDAASGRFDKISIHTRCIPKHWGKHAKGINASKCVELAAKFAKKKTVNKRRVSPFSRSMSEGRHYDR
jgi:hypothetical protein